MMLSIPDVIVFFVLVFIFSDDAYFGVLRDLL
jgi:hypothetical protein